MRGRTFENAVVILDEAQKCDCGANENIFLTRLGENVTVIVSSDITQPNGSLPRGVRFRG